MDGRLFGVGCLTVVACGAASAALPATYPTLAVAGLLGVCLAVASALDDEAAAVTDATPRTVRDRTLARAQLAVVPLAVWIGVGLLLDLRYPDWPLLLGAAIGVAVAVAAFGLAAAFRAAGAATPGEAVGTALGVLILGLLFVSPTVRGVSPFLPEPAALLWWAPMLGVGLAALAVGTRDRMRPRTGVRRHGPPDRQG